MIEKVEQIIKLNKMIEAGDKILVAVSGGPDSLCLVDILINLQAKLNFNLHVAHLNHMFRGKEAEADADYVLDYCTQRGINSSIEAINVEEYKKATGKSSQLAAREVRYKFLDRVAKAEGCNKIALGHHADDQAETILMNFLRGAGLKGLRGIRPINDNLIRPLINLRRSQIENYCKENNLNPRIDSSNFKDIYLRNKIRNSLIPFLEEEYNPQLVENLSQMAKVISDENDYLTSIIEERYKGLVKETANNQRVFKSVEFIQLPLAVQRRLFIDIWNKSTGEYRELQFKHVEEVLEFIKSGPANGILNLPKGYSLVKEYDLLKLAKLPLQTKAGDFSFTLEVPGKLKTPEANWEIRVDYFKQKPEIKKNQILLDYQKVTLPLIARNRRAGDRVKLSGVGTKKLKDILIDLKVPVGLRDTLPIITDQKGIVWVCGLRQGAEYEINEETEEYLVLTINDL